MNKDFRVSVGFFDHPKIVKLQRRHGQEAVIALLRLYAFAAQNRPSGVLSGLDDEDLAIAIHWEGNVQQLLVSFLDLHLLNKHEEGLVIHDWEVHNGYAAHAAERSEKARRAAAARWGKKHDKCSKQCSEHGQALPKADFSNAPSPITVPDSSPSPDPFPAPAQPEASPKSETFGNLFDLAFDSDDDLPWLNREAWTEFEQYRCRIKKPLDNVSRKKNLAVLEKDKAHQQEIIDRSIANSWTGLFPLPVGSGGGRRLSAVDRVDAANGGRQQI